MHAHQKTLLHMTPKWKILQRMVPKANAEEEKDDNSKKKKQRP